MKVGKASTKLVRKRRKSDHCLNCGASFDIKVNYCPHCGQENNHNRVSFGTLVIDFLNNYFSFDSKFTNSLLPFFFQPGYLTRKFVEGKRTSFVNPIRLYLIISLVFFFVFSMVSTDIVENTAREVNDATQNLDEDRKEAVDNILSGNLSKFEGDTTIVLSDNESEETTYKVSLTKPDSSNEFVTEENIQTFMKLKDNYDLSADQILDSLDTSSLTTFEYSLARKFIRLVRSDRQVIVGHILNNLPIMMLFTLPFFALLLKLFYIRKQQYYITHLIHALHLHSFAYVLYGFAFILAYYLVPEGVGIYILAISFILISIHSYLSFLNVYEQGWFKTLTKFSVLGVLYGWLILFAIIIELAFSVATF